MSKILKIASRRNFGRNTFQIYFFKWAGSFLVSVNSFWSLAHLRKLGEIIGTKFSRNFDQESFSEVKLGLIRRKYYGLIIISDLIDSWIVLFCIFQTRIRVFGWKSEFKADFGRADIFVKVWFISLKCSKYVLTRFLTNETVTESNRIKSIFFII